MSNFVVSARKYRPNRFEDVVGQEHVSQTLKNALSTNHLAHAFLFCGPRGVGKTTCARILAKVMNCSNITENYEPCNQCANCQAFNENASFNIMELDAASNNSVDHIRQLVEQVRFQPQQGKYKIFIIDEVHMLSPSAFNAFLKTLEEPPPYAIFILATTEKHKIIPTILSRCQIFDFRRIQVPAIVAHLETICNQEGIKAEKDVLHIIAQKADGALRDALSIFDRIVSATGKSINYENVIENLNILDYDYFFKVTNALLTEDVSNLLLTFDDILRKGFEADIFINGLAEHLRNLLVCKDAKLLQLLEVSDKLKSRYQEQANIASTSFVLTALSIANDCDINYRLARNKRLHTEMALIKMCYISRAALPVADSSEKKKLSVSNTPAATPSIDQKSQEQQAVKEKPTPIASAILAPTLKEEETPIYTTALPEESVAEEPEKPVQPSTTTPPPTGKKLSFNLAALEEDVLKEDAAQKAASAQEEVVPLALEGLKAAWNAFIQQSKQANVNNIMRNTDLEVVSDAEFKMVVSSGLAENTLKQDATLIPFLRKELKNPKLSRQIIVDTSKLAQDQQIKKPLTDKEKLKNMHQINPLVEQLYKKFDLKLDS